MKMGVFQRGDLIVMQGILMTKDRATIRPHKHITEIFLTCVENWEVSCIMAFFQSPIYCFLSLCVAFDLNLQQMPNLKSIPNNTLLVHQCT